MYTQLDTTGGFEIAFMMGVAVFLMISKALENVK
jgi:hypothetical protein